MPNKTKKLVYEATKHSVKLHDVIDHPTLGRVTVEDVRAPKHKSGIGRVELKNAAGFTGDYSPDVIAAIWI